MTRARLGYRTGTGATRGRRLGLGVGAAAALVKLVAAAMLTALVVVSFVYRWNPFVIIVVGLAWAIVFAGMILVPTVSSRIADALVQDVAWPRRSRRQPVVRSAPSDSWDGTERRRPVYVPDIGLNLPASRGLMARPDLIETTPGFDWTGFVQAVADRLEAALGEGFTAHADGPALVLHHEDLLRRVNLGQIFQPPPLDVGERALRGCLKMMDEAQMFSMRVRRSPWPNRGETDRHGASDLARPRVRLEEGEIRMAWADEAGTLLRLQPLPFGGAAPGGRDSNW